MVTKKVLSPIVGRSKMSKKSREGRTQEPKEGVRRLEIRFGVQQTELRVVVLSLLCVSGVWGHEGIQKYFGAIDPPTIFIRSEFDGPKNWQVRRLRAPRYSSSIGYDLTSS